MNRLASPLGLFDPDVERRAPNRRVYRRRGTRRVAYTPRELLGECFRTLRSQVLVRTRSGCRSFMFVSTRPQEGKSTITVNLAPLLAASGRRVLLVDCDLRRPSLHRLLGVRNACGFTDLMSGRRALSEVAQELGNGIALLPSGPIDADPQHLLLSDKLDTALTAMKNAFDIVLIDSAPVLSVADAGLIAGHVDAVVMVMRSGVARAAEVRLVQERLTAAGGRIIGSVLNHFNGPAGQDYHPYSYAYAYPSPG